MQLTHDHLARVPVPPAQMNPSIPSALSAIVMHLLEKEPDNRYQSAEGLTYDLERLDHPGVQTVGGDDFPVRLLRRRDWSGATTRWRRWVGVRGDARRPVPWRLGQRGAG